MHPTILDTLELVKKEHGQTNALDKGGKTPYYWHLLRVMLRIKNPSEDLLHIALLHDIVEDTAITLNDLKTLGYNDNIIECVRWCSRNMFPDLTFTQWMQKIGQEAPHDAVIVKIADISDNLGFERMHGLMNKGSGGKEINKKKSNHQYPMQLRIDKKVSKKMKLFGEMGVYDRYYKGWNNIFENQDLLPLIDHVSLTDFCDITQLKKLIQWLPKEDQLSYFDINKLNTWIITGQLNIINDKAGNPYVALVVENDIGLLYQHCLENYIDKDYISNQQKRDHNNFHITVINAMQYGKVKNNNLLPQLNNSLGKTFSMFSYGVGSIEESKNDKKAWFIVVENMELTNWRNQFNVSAQDFHVTLAFKNGDVFGQRKNRETVVINNSTIWQHCVSHDFKHTKEKKLKM